MFGAKRQFIRPYWIQRTVVAIGAQHYVGRFCLLLPLLWTVGIYSALDLRDPLLVFENDAYDSNRATNNDHHDRNQKRP